MAMDASAIAEGHAAALLHDVGRTAVSSENWDRAGPLGQADQERVRLHSYWTERILARCPAIAALSPIAAAHHERLDGTGTTAAPPRPSCAPPRPSCAPSHACWPP